MVCGWTGCILQVDLTERSITRLDTMDYTPHWIGGRALATRIAWEDIPPGIDAYDPQNTITVATGPLTGTLAPTSGRTVMTGVSPRTYPLPWHTHSTMGGWFGAELKYAGYDAVVVRGRADAPVVLHIEDEEAHLRDGSDLWGRGARETQLALRGEAGSGAQVLAIGQAGENLIRFATVQHAESNAAGHSGFGAVWGSKNLKAIVVRGTGGVRVAHPEALLREVLAVPRQGITPAPGVLRGDRAGESGFKAACSQACLFDCRTADSRARAPDGRRIPGFCIEGLALGNAGMAGTAYEGGGVVVPAGENFGAPAELRFYALCNDLGLDLWFRIVMQPWLIRCRQVGVDRIRGHRLEPNDGAWFLHFTGQIARREGLGALFADDLRRAMDELEGELPQELIDLGRELEFDFGFPAHREGRFWDEEPLPFWVISAMMHISESRDPTIGSHQSVLSLAEFLVDDVDLARARLRTVSAAVWGDPNALEPTFDDKAPVAIWSQHQHILVDSLPMCDFAFPQVVRSMKRREEWLAGENIVGDLDLGRRLFAAVTGVEMTREELDLVAERAFTLERVMLARAGRGRPMEEQLATHFALPCRDDGTRLDRDGFARLMDEYYGARGWDLELGWPQENQLRALGLEAAIAQLAAARLRSAAASAM
jgi:aldehyde:ferredoxin oxidoreductase